jgi:hypothetical protein
VKITEQLPDARVHCVGVKVPPESDAKLTVPVGMTGVPSPVSVTVTVHVAFARGFTEFCWHATETETGLGVTSTFAAPTPALCRASPW